jgi:hypothetical protein
VYGPVPGMKGAPLLKAELYPVDGVPNPPWFITNWESIITPANWAKTSGVNANGPFRFTTRVFALGHEKGQELFCIIARSWPEGLVMPVPFIMSMTERPKFTWVKLKIG